MQKSKLQVKIQNRPVKRLGEIIVLNYGKGIAKNERNASGKYPVYGANGVLDYADKYLVEGEAVIVGRKGSAGEITRVWGKFWPSDVTYYVLGLGNDKIDVDYLFHALKNLNIQRLAVGVKPGINRNRVYELEIPLPPLWVQRKIVAKLEGLLAKVSEAKKLRAEARESADDLLSAELHKIFEGGKNLIMVGDICDIKGGKRLPRGHKLRMEKTNHPYIRVVDFIPYAVDKSKIKFIDDDTFSQIKRYTISKDDVFISIAGTIGATGIIPEDLDGANLTENAAKLTNLRNVEQKYLMYMLTSNQAQEQIRNDLIQTTISKFGLFRIAKLKIPLPPIAEQKKIVKHLDSLSEKVRELRQHQKSTQSDLLTLEQSILHKAFV